MLYLLTRIRLFVTIIFNNNDWQRLSILLGLSLVIVSCTNTATPADTQNTSDIFHQESTVLFANKKASVSLRASFIQKTSGVNDTTTSGTTTQSLLNGYKFQFRAILKGNNTIEKVSIIAGGEKIVLSDKPLFILPGKGLTINTNKEDALFIMNQNDATLRFKFNQESHLMSIRNHTLSEFIVPI